MQLLWGYDDDEGSLFLSGPIVKHFQAKKLQNFFMVSVFKSYNPQKGTGLYPQKGTS